MFDHLMKEDLLAVEDFDGKTVTGVDVFCELDLRKATLTQSSPKLIFPDACSRRRCLLHAHLLP